MTDNVLESTVWPVNENGELLFQRARGSSKKIGGISSSYVPVDISSGRAVIDLPPSGYSAYQGIYNATKRSLNTATPAFANTATGGTEIYIDFNRGNDANPGTRLLPKKNLSVISGASYGAGSLIALASDSVWELVGTTTTVNQINCDNIFSTNPASPVYITSYDPAGHTGSKPTITHCWKPAAGEWVFDATYSGWYYTVTNTIYPGPNTAVFFGADKLQGVNIWQDSNHANLPPFFTDYQYSWRTDYATFKRVYVWAPANTDPTTYYGEVRIFFSRGALYTGSNGLRNTVIDGLKFINMGSGIGVNAIVAGAAHTGLVVKNCETSKAGLLDYYNGAANANSLVAYSNKGFEVPCAFIKIAGSSTGTTDFDIYSNDVRGCNRQFAAMAAVYTNQACSALGLGKVHHNYFYDCQNGTGSEYNGAPGSVNTGYAYGCAYDGTAVYFDINSNRNIMFGNIIERCHVAMQTNSAKNAQIIGNIAIDCNVLATCTDAATLGSNDVLVMNNTYLNRLPDQNQLKHGTASKPDFAFTNWYENATSSSIRVLNNAFYRLVPDGLREAIRIEKDAGTKIVSGNALYGWTNTQKVVAKRLVGPEVDDLTATSLNVTSDGANWFEGKTANLPVTSPLIGAGSRYMDGLSDMTGTAFNKFPSIGALEYVVQ